jgi:protein-S-isoprenylcysteine O-methyltransferase Ste14
MSLPRHEASDASPTTDSSATEVPRGGAADESGVGHETTMLPERRARPPLESAFVRIVATCGVVGIGVALGAILRSQSVAGWIIGLVVALVSVIVSAVLWSSRRM